MEETASADEVVRAYKKISKPTRRQRSAKQLLVALIKFVSCEGAVEEPEADVANESEGGEVKDRKA